MFFAAGDYRHAPAGVVQLRVIRGGSSYAEIDLGSGLRRVFTRPGDLLLSLPGRATRFKIEGAARVDDDHHGSCRTSSCRFADS